MEDGVDSQPYIIFVIQNGLTLIQKEQSKKSYDTL